MNFLEVNLVGGALVLIMLHFLEGLLTKIQDSKTVLPRSDPIYRMTGFVVILLSLWCLLAVIASIASVISGDTLYFMKSLIVLFKNYGVATPFIGKDEIQAASIEHFRYLSGLASIALLFVSYCGYLDLLSIKKMLKNRKSDPK